VEDKKCGKIKWRENKMAGKQNGGKIKWRENKWGGGGGGQNGEKLNPCWQVFGAML
jgi:hypothetical protein